MTRINLDDDWDWSLLYYVGTVILGMTEEEFWKCTPRKLFSLLTIHGEVSGQSDGQGKIKDSQQALKQFMSW